VGTAALGCPPAGIRLFGELQGVERCSRGFDADWTVWHLSREAAACESPARKCRESSANGEQVP